MIAGTSVVQVIGRLIGATISAVALVLVGRMNSRATVRAAEISSAGNRPGRPPWHWFLVLPVIGGVAVMVASAWWSRPDGADRGSAIAEAGARDLAEEDAIVAPSPTVSSDEGQCPDREQFARAGRRSDGDFMINDLPADGSSVVLQVVVRGRTTELVVSICEDDAGAYWYFSRTVDDELTGTIARAAAIRDAFQADVTFPGDDVTFIVGDDGVMIMPREELLPLIRVVCAADDLPGALASLEQAAGCTTDLVEPWHA